MSPILASISLVNYKTGRPNDSLGQQGDVLKWSSEMDTSKSRKTERESLNSGNILDSWKDKSLRIIKKPAIDNPMK